ncbi:cytochrome ubiquinol oxidase subunit I [Shigella flexneri]
MAWLLMQEMSQGNREPHVLQAFRELEGDLGYGMLLSRYAPDMNHVTAAQYQAAMRGAIPSGCAGILEFPHLVGCGSLLLLVMLIALVQTLRGKIDQHRWVLKMALWSLPLPWIAIEAGWFMTEFGRQPWAIQDILPTYSAHSALTTGQLASHLNHDRRALHPVLNRRSLPDARCARLGPSAMQSERPTQRQG